MNTTIQLNLNSSEFISAQPLSPYASKTRNAIIGSIFGGYGRTWNHLYLAGEFAVSNSDYTMANSVSTALSRTLQCIFTIQANDNLSTQSSVSPTQFGLFLRPGVLFTPNSLLYSRLGVSVATINFDTITRATRVLREGPTTSVNLPPRSFRMRGKTVYAV